MIVNSPLREMNSFVPSSGSTSRNRSPVSAGFPEDVELLGDDRNSRSGVGQLGADDRFRALIGKGNRAAVAFGPCLAASFINVHDRGSRRDCGVGEEERNLVCVSPIEIELTHVRMNVGQKNIPSWSSQAVGERPAKREASGAIPNMSPPTRESDTGDERSRRRRSGIDHRIGCLTIVAPLDLAALLCSRVCHDVIGPVGAIMNGLEMLDSEQDEDTRAVALDLIKKSATSASMRLQFCRLAFGAAGSLTAAIDTGDAERVARGLIANERTALVWNGPRRLAPKNAVKLLLNLCLISASAIPRGGVVAVEYDGEDEAMTMKSKRQEPMPVFLTPRRSS